MNLNYYFLFFYFSGYNVWFYIVFLGHIIFMVKINDKTYVVAMGGSAIFEKHEGNYIFKKDTINSFFKHFNEGIQKGFKFIVVVGGGAPSRLFINKVEATFGERGKDFLLHEMGIQQTKMNALAMGYAFEREFGINVMCNPDINFLGLFDHQITFMGGTEPRQTTDTVAVKAAINVKGELINISKYPVMTEDPEQNPNATLIKKMTHKELAGLVGLGKEKIDYLINFKTVNKDWSDSEIIHFLELENLIQAGCHGVFDPVATALALRHNIPITFVGQDDFKAFGKVISNNPYYPKTVTVVRD